MELDDLLAALARWSADAAVSEGVERRRRERWLRQQAAEEATLASVVADLVEREASVVVCLRDGHRRPGRLAGLGRDFVVVAATGETVLVPLGAVGCDRADERRGHRADEGGGRSGRSRWAHDRCHGRGRRRGR